MIMDVLCLDRAHNTSSFLRPEKAILTAAPINSFKCNLDLSRGPEVLS